MHQSADRVVGAEVAVGFLVDAVGVFGAEDDARAALVALELVEGALDLPALAVEPGELVGGRGRGRGSSSEPVSLLGCREPWVVDPVFDDAYLGALAVAVRSEKACTVVGEEPSARGCSRGSFMFDSPARGVRAGRACTWNRSKL